MTPGPVSPVVSGEALAAFAVGVWLAGAAALLWLLLARPAGRLLGWAWRRVVSR